MKKLLIVALAVAITGCSRAYQSQPQYKILYSSDDIVGSKDSSIRYILASDFANRVTVRYHDGRKKKIDFPQLWGYVGEKGEIYRIYKDKIYEITLVGDTVKYFRKEQRSVGKPVYTGNFKVKYKSIGLDGEIFRSSGLFF